MNKTGKQSLALICWIVGLISMSSVIGLLTRNSVDTWYSTLNRSPLSPPNDIFGIVWPVLYIMIAISGWLIWHSKNTRSHTTIKKLFITQLLLNWSWTPLFFTYHLIGPALVCLITIIVLLAILIVKSFRPLRIVSLLLTPYFLWSLFAGYLNFYLWLFN